MKTDYKYYFFYKENELYAYTDDKQIADQFMVERNMNLFKKKKVDLSRKDVNDLAEYHNHKIIRNRNLLTSKNGRSINVHLALTDEEMFNINSKGSYIINLLLVKAWESPEIFVDSIKKALYNLGYYHLNRELGENDSFLTMYDDINIRIDLLSILIEIYGDLFLI